MGKITKSFTPTKAVLNNSLRGKALIVKNNKNLQKLFKAERLKECEIKDAMSLEEIKEVYSCLNQLSRIVDLKKAQRNHEDSKTLLWKSLGASSGLAWCKLILKQEGVIKTGNESDLNNKVNSEINTEISVVKSVNEELMQATFIALVPDEVDLHGDIYSEEEVRKACHSYNKHCRKANMLHIMNTDLFDIVESYTLLSDLVLDDKFVKKGTWVTVLQFNDEDLWEEVKKGNFVGVSIGAMASVEYLESEE